MAKFTPKQKAECAERELKLRREVYARRQAGGHLTQFQEHQIALMEEIMEDYRKASAEELPDLLFVVEELFDGDRLSEPFKARLDKEVRGMANGIDEWGRAGL